MVHKGGKSRARGDKKGWQPRRDRGKIVVSVSWLCDLAAWNA